MSDRLRALITEIDRRLRQHANKTSDTLDAGKPCIGIPTALAEDVRAALAAVEAPATDLSTKLDRAYREMSAAVERQWSGQPALSLSIPACPDRDTDLLVCAALAEAKEFVDAALRGATPETDIHKA